MNFTGSTSFSPAPPVKYAFQPGAITVADPADDGSHGPPRLADETRPTNMSVVWILHHKHPWTDLGGSLAGSTGTPVLVGLGPLVESEPYGVRMSNAAPGSPAHLVMSLAMLNAPFKGGTLVPQPDIVVLDLPTSGGSLTLTGTWPTSIPGGIPFYVQIWISDATGPAGFTASNGLQGVSEGP